ncbi:phosphoglycerol transferase [Mizugakiibacter sediminis]|uniref:Phosphoglycerol transferase n=2 Tax=Mizugakiibacter sediminis TaxID=1475481 RepID=A0A0K8QKP1_9GAMM|nr:LTA synthase family protein [Mizugakiibacter sediminis]GAP65510.1 phosphoglycerol transferase [Mizugakiibacter sediminis]
MRHSRLETVERWALAPLLGTAFVLWSALLDGAAGLSPASLLSAPEAPLRLLANALPGLLLALLLFALTRRAFAALGLALLLEALLYAANALKLANLDTPLMPADFRLLGQLGQGAGHLLGRYVPPVLALTALGLLAGALLLLRYEPPLLPRRRLPRLALAGFAFTALATLCAGVPAWRQVYAPQRLGLQPWSASMTARHAGLVSTLAMYRLEYAGRRLAADPLAAEALIAAHAPTLRAEMDAAPPVERPDIVVVQSESFFDPGRLRGVDGAALVPHLARLQREGAGGRLHVPTFGGGTIRTEFEVLTGLSLRYLPDVQFPYLQIHGKAIPGLVRTLREHGYLTIAVHPNDAGFWNRSAAFKALGFERFVALSAFPADAPRDGLYVADRALTDEVLAQLRDDGPPRFVFAISMEAHGPYGDSPGIDAAARDAIPVPAGVEGSARRELQNYLYHLRHADAELGRLAAALAQRPRPTLLLFYGDHLPALVDAYRALGFVDGGDMLRQTVPWLLIDPRHPQEAPRRDLASWMLPALLLDRAGIRDDAWFAFLRTLPPQLAALTHAPDAAPSPPGGEFDRAMASVVSLRLRGRLDPLLPQPPPHHLAAAPASPPAPRAEPHSG